MSKNQVRFKTNQPGVYQNQQTGKYDVKYCYTEYDPTRDEKRYKAKWVYGINSYQTAVNTLAKMKAKKITVNREDITLKDALKLWENKAIANKYSEISIRNTKQQYSMITHFWVPETKLRFITEESYLNLISQCRGHGYSEETVYNINACLRKLVKLAYRNHHLPENPFTYCDNARIQPHPAVCSDCSD